LKAHIGTVVTIDGKYSLDKLGDVVETPQISLLFDLGYGPTRSAKFGTPIKVTGTLAELSYPPAYPYELENADFIELALPSDALETKAR
jgi:hypothetical protein